VEPTTHPSRVLPCAAVLLSLLGLVATLSAVVPLPAQQADAAVPTPGPGQAVVTVRIGDLRTSATTIGPLEGVTLGLFRTRPPDGSVNENTGFTTATPNVTCVSDADGDCSFTVPIGTGTGEIPQGTRMWVAKLGAPDGYYANPWWQTAPLTPSGQDPRVNMRHIWPTPALVAGQTYRSGSEWVTDPGLTAPTGTPEASINNYRQRAASSGIVSLSRENNPLPQQCGLRVALVADLSGSMQGSVPQLKSGMDAFVDALRGTPSQVALYTFGTDSPATGYPQNTGLQPVATTADADRVKAQYRAWSNNPGANYTNWDRGLGAVGTANAGLTDPLDLVVFLTDGNPTVYGPITNNRIPANSGYTRFRELGNAIPSANLIKSVGTRVLAVGVGDGVSSEGAGFNLRTISGRTAYDGTNAATADYMQSPDFATVGDSLRDVVLSGCAPSVNVIKQVVPADGGVEDAYTPSDPWDFSAETTTEGATVEPAAGSTDPSTGALSFDMTFDPDDAPAGLRVEEANKPGYTPMPEETVCVDKSSGDDVQVPHAYEPDSDTAWTVDVGTDSVISCTVYNRAPDFSQASVAVHKRWRVVTATGTQDYAQGSQPSDMQAWLALEGPALPDLRDQPWSVPRDGYDTDNAIDNPVRFQERIQIIPPECEMSQVTLEDGPPSASEPASGENLPTTAPVTDQPIAGGQNEWTITNVVECHSYLTLSKQVNGGDGDPQWWNLDAIAPAGALAGPGGTDGTPGATRIEVTPDATYQLAESLVEPGDEPHGKVHYVQQDLRSRPLLYDQSTGSWNCDVVDDTGEGTPVAALGTEGAVSVPIGHHMECTAINQTATLNVTKVVQGGDAEPEDFTFEATPIEPYQPGADHTDTIAGAGSPLGTTVNLTPNQHYDFSEVDGPDGYYQYRQFCITAEQVLNANNFTLLPGARAACQVTNRALSGLTVQKVDEGSRDPLGGATFDLVRDDGDSTYEPNQDTLVASCTTAQSSGTCSVDELQFGTFFWVETSPPPGYELPDPAVSDPIVINAGNAGTAIEPTVVEDPQRLTDLTVLKVDSEETPDPLPGATFELRRNDNGNEVGDEPDPADPVVGECTTGANGRCTVPDLPFGGYYWVETVAPEGYSLPEDLTSPLVTVNAGNAGEQITPYRFTNPRLPGAAEVEKLDAETRQPLPAATFELYQDDGDGSYDLDDTLIGECTTPDTGVCGLEDLDFGTYFWVEVDAPQGYTVPEAAVSGPIEITADNVEETQQVTFLDPRELSRLVVRKLDQADDSPLAGGVFELYRDSDGDGVDGVTDDAPDPDDTLAGSCTTEANGRCAVDELGWGDYYWFEAEAPAGYDLPADRTGDLVTIDAGTAGTELQVTVFRDTAAGWTVGKSSDPASGSEVAPNQVITYTVTARLLGGTPVPDATATDDVSDVLDDALFVPGSISTTAGSASRDGTRLVWRIGRLAQTETLTYQVRVRPVAAGSNLSNVVSAPPGGGYVPCEDLAAGAMRVARLAGPECRSTDHRVPPAPGTPTPPPNPPGTPPDTPPAQPPSPAETPPATDASGASDGSDADGLADTGGPSLLLLLGGLLLLGAGGVLAYTGRRGRRHTDG